MIRFLRYLLLPFSLLYGIIVWLRHKAYDYGWFSSVKFDEPTICVGNLSVGGTGKTPMVEYLIRHLLPNYGVGVVSRGYKRKTKGLVLADENATVFDLGDEPFQIWKKYPEIVMIVNSNRAEAIRKILQYIDKPNVIILDDAFQHRKVQAKKTILLTAYGNLFTDDWLLPTGNLRDIKARATHASVIVVTKCPLDISNEEREKITEKIRKKSNSQVVFAKISYAAQVYSLSKSIDFKEFIKRSFVLVTGIANPKPLVRFLKEQEADFEHFDFPDHHHFSSEEIEKLKKYLCILTTEKDFVRLQSHLQNIYYLPIETDFVSKQDEQLFWQILGVK
ncbi:tetraacyldisaccharide 4'-kinase [Capnocytophaga sp.]|uniref:tetraacyldisaccharide 4'-kinase n=1 Tax=Capnocytophaga sp. TaxID=44737 RepID=UPI0026DD33D6|nr:tetraacyldisaccharide 4'-kinase [Capnocytophaga sp.]MDO5105691.1 tetraacyldisaccharide 4'-kinase [Capnocytophaga sp.]